MGGRSLLIQIPNMDSPSCPRPRQILSPNAQAKALRRHGIRCPAQSPIKSLFLRTAIYRSTLFTNRTTPPWWFLKPLPRPPCVLTRPASMRYKQRLLCLRIPLISPIQFQPPHAIRRRKSSFPIRRLSALRYLGRPSARRAYRGVLLIISLTYPQTATSPILFLVSITIRRATEAPSC